MFNNIHFICIVKIKLLNHKLAKKIKPKNTFKTASFEIYGIGKRNTDYRGSLLYAYDLKPTEF